MTSLWKIEHGSSYAVPERVLALVAEGRLYDDSWHNDVCPRFDTALRGRTLTLWIEHPDPNEREDGPETKRYLVQEFDEEDYFVEDIIATDNLNEALTKMGM